MTVPLADSSTTPAAGSLKEAPSLTVAVDPRASVIWEAIVRFQINS